MRLVMGSHWNLYVHFAIRGVFMFLYDQFFKALQMAGGYFQFQAPQLRVIPLRVGDSKSQEKATDLVRQIMAATKSN
jgi:hypothetical protein